MDAIEFKCEIKAIKKNLKGITIQFVTGRNVTPYYSLRQFGLAVLKEENLGSDFYLNQIWTRNGVVKVNSFSVLKEIFQKEEVTGISFAAHYTPKSFNESLRYGYKYND